MLVQPMPGGNKFFAAGIGWRGVASGTDMAVSTAPWQPVHGPLAQQPMELQPAAWAAGPGNSAALTTVWVAAAASTRQVAELAEECCTDTVRP